MSLLDRFRRPTPEPAAKRSLFDFASEASFMFGGIQYPGGMQMTQTGERVEPVGNSFDGYVAGAMKSSGPVFAVMENRRAVLSEIRFQWQQMNGGRPGNLFGNTDLSILETPWVNGTTGDLVSRMEQHDSLTGNAFVVRRGNVLRVLRPDWVGIVLSSPSGDPHDLDAEPFAYVYWPGGQYSGNAPITLGTSEVAHYAPTPDPQALYRGMSWMTAILREIEADIGATKHKLRFFENAATPNLAVSLDKAITTEQFRDFIEAMDKSHKGAENAYKTLYLAGGADVTVIGSDLKQIDFGLVQGAGESRIAAAANCPPSLAGLGPDPTYMNFSEMRRAWADKFLRPHWREMAAALETLLPVPNGARLWYDSGSVSFLQADEKDAADISAQQATTIRTLVDAGYTPESAVLAVTNSDMTQLVHSGLYSVQLQAAGSSAPMPA
jgi:phage portal protein BeeE